MRGVVSCNILLGALAFGCTVLLGTSLGACSGDKPNPTAGYRVQITLDERFDVTKVTGVQVVLDALPFGPALGLTAGGGESVTVNGTVVNSRRTDVDADGQVEVVYVTTGSPFAQSRTFELPLRSPGYATVPFYLRVDVFGATGLLGSATAGATSRGRALNFDLGDSEVVSIAVACVESRSCTGAGADAGVGDGGVVADAGATDGGVVDAGLRAPTNGLAFSRDTNDDGVEDLLELFVPATGQRSTLMSGAELDALAWSDDGQNLLAVRATGQGAAELVAITPGGAPRVLASGPALTDLTLSQGGAVAAVRALADGGATWLVRGFAGQDGGLDVSGASPGALGFTGGGADVVVPTPTGDGGVSVSVSRSDTLELRVLLALTRFVASALSPLGGHVAVLGQRASDSAPALYLVSTLGDPLVRLLPESAVGQLRDLAFSADGLRLGLRGDLQAVGVQELFVLSPGLRGVSGGIAPGGTGVTQWAFHPSDSSRVAFLADRRTAGTRELYAASVTGAQGPTRLSADGLDAGLADFAYSPRGARIAYRTGGRLFVVRLNEAPVDLGAADAYAWSPDEQWLAVVREASLFIVSHDGAQTVGPIATGLREKRLAWRP